MTHYETILVEQRGAVTLVTLNRPQALNALNNQVLGELVAAMRAFDADPSQGCAVLTGSEKAFAAGADIKEMQPQSFGEMYGHDYFGGWELFNAESIALKFAAVPSWILAFGLTLFEALVQFLQAYVFTLLAASYIGGALVDEH